MLSVGVSGEGGDEGVGVGEINGLGRVLSVNFGVGVKGGRRDLLQRRGTVDSGVGGWGRRRRRQRGSSEARVAGPGPAEKRNDLLELGDSDVSDSPVVVGLNFHG